MKKIALVLLANLSLTAAAYANIPYCPGTHVKGNKHHALQYVITSFAHENNCEEAHCVQNFDQNKYAVTWGKDCPDSARRGNDPAGSTFICQNHECTPLGFSLPQATY